MHEHGVHFSLEGPIIYQLPTGKVGIPIAIFEAGFHLLVSDFFNEVMREYGFFEDHNLTPNDVNKIVGFELGDLVGASYPCVPMASDRVPQLLGVGLSVVHALRGFFFNGEDWSDCVLATCEMSVGWRSRGKMPQFYVDNDVFFLKKKGGFALLPFQGSVPPVEVGVRATSPVRGSSMATAQSVSRRRSASIDSSLEEDISGSTIGQRLHRKHNIDPLLANSSIVNEITYGDDLKVPARVWSRHAFPSVTLEALDALSYSHVANDLMYVAAQVALYLVAVVGHLCYIGENTIVESRLATLDGEKVAVRVVDHVVESSESAVWIFRVNVVSMATGTERRKQKARVWTSGSSPGSSNLDVAARSIDAMHVAIKAFSKMDFMSYLHLVELGLTDLH
ncbi:unnamed protein product [Lactuca saligna]|uniref:Uncharacterized protein n=1 Tax=Lactuca saligna TaxID=75948 RepID=A0AA36EK97_LACSI|nr:unnamed protein product [Lactuca saligna]